MPTSKPTSIDEYLNDLPDLAQEKMRELRAILKKIVPKATEAIKWGALVFEEERILFSYKSHKNYINFMPTGPSLKPFKKELEKFKTGKDTIQLPYSEPIPAALIKKIAEYRAKDVQENDAKWMY